MNTREKRWETHEGSSLSQESEIVTMHVIPLYQLKEIVLRIIFLYQLLEQTVKEGTDGRGLELLWKYNDRISPDEVLIP